MYSTTLHHNIQGLYNYIKNLQIACHKYDVIFFSETLKSDRWHVWEISISGFNKPMLLRMIKIGFLLKIVHMHFLINKTHIFDSHRIDHIFCGRSMSYTDFMISLSYTDFMISLSYTDFMISLSMMPHY